MKAGVNVFKGFNVKKLWILNCGVTNSKTGQFLPEITDRFRTSGLLKVFTCKYRGES